MAARVASGFHFSGGVRLEYYRGLSTFLLRNDFLKAGFTFPEDQDVYLQLLEHAVLAARRMRKAAERATTNGRVDLG